jgi:hypothetical protein
MDAAHEPFDGAAIDGAATELRHPRLPNAEVGRDDVLALRTAERSRDLRGELPPDKVDRIVGRYWHARAYRDPMISWELFVASSGLSSREEESSGCLRKTSFQIWNTQVFEIWVRPGISGLALPSSPAGSLKPLTLH